MTTSALRSGPGYWLASLGSMLRFEYGKVRRWAGMMVVVQTLMGAGMALMYGFFYPHITPARALYITTGSPTLALIPLGFVMLPGAIGMEKLEGTFDYIWSLPAPRSAQATATFLVYSLIALPGTALALVAATWRYGADLSLSPLLVPAALVCALVAITVGYGMALAIPNPMVTNVITNALVFFVLLFSPIVYPTSQPAALALRPAPRIALLQHGHRHPSRPDRWGRERRDDIFPSPSRLGGRGVRSDGVGRRPPPLSEPTSATVPRRFGGGSMKRVGRTRAGRLFSA